MGQSIKTLKRFSKLPWPDQALLHALFLAATIRLALFLVPFGIVQRIVGDTSKRPKHRHTPKHTTWAVTAASRYVPGGTCLTQALTVQVLLRRLGYDSRIEFGVQKTPENRLDARAWVACGDEIVVGGGHDLDRYAYLTSSETRGLG